MRRPLTHYIPGASAEQDVQGRMHAVAQVMATAGAQRNTLRKNVTARRFTGDVINPMDMRVGNAVTAAQLADAVASAPPHLPGLFPAPSVRRGY